MSGRKMTPTNADGSHRRYFRVMEDILDDPKMSDLSAEAFRTFIRLLAMLNRTRSTTGKITVDRRTICFIAARSRVDYAEASFRQLEARSLLAMTKVGPSYDLAVRNWSKLNGLGFHSDTDTDTDTETTRNSAFGGGKTPSEPAELDGTEGFDWLLPQLRLTASSTADERTFWARSEFPEIVATAEIETQEGDKISAHIKRYAIRKWNAYLRERDPGKRTYALEARRAASVAAREALDRQLDGEPGQQLGLGAGVSDPDPELVNDPLAFVRTGVNPYAN